MQRLLRHKTIIRTLGSQKVSVAALADLTGASAITIRRDLDDLEGQGLLRRVHGGAVRADSRGALTPYERRAAEQLDQKQALARCAGALVQDEDSVILDNGSTLLALAHELAGRPLTAMCMSLHAAVALGGRPQTRVLTPGGPITTDGLGPTSGAAAQALAELRADIALLGACAASPGHGLTSTTWEDALIKKAIIASSSRRIVVATGDKLSRTTSFRVAAIEDIHDLVTTPDAQPTLLQHFVDAGVRVHIAR